MAEGIAGPILLTGATGMVGRSLVPRLLADGRAVTGTARRRPDWWPAGAAFLEHDFFGAETSLLSRAVGSASTIIHACDLGKRDIPRNREVSARLYELCRRAECDAFYYVSSIRVYSSIFGDVDESTPPAPAPSDPYGLCKLEIETALREKAEKGGPPLVVLRLGNVFRWDTPHKFPKGEALLTRLLYRGMSHHLISADNVAHALSRLLETGIGRNVETFNVTQEIDGENDYFYLADRVAGVAGAVPRRPSPAALALRHHLARLRGESAAGYFLTVRERRLREYGILYPESLAEGIVRAAGRLPRGETAPPARSVP